MMKPGAAETAPLLQRDETLLNKPKPGAIAAAVRQAKRGVGVFGVALALSGVLVAIMAGAPDAGTKKRAARESSHRPPRHRRDACSMAWRCRFLAARQSQDGHVIAEK